MGLNINLFVHGVPMGQKIWGPKGDDQMYLSSFYGPKWDMAEVMKIDVMTLGGVTYCYYSFIKGLNVCDSQGRAGSYFALTLRVNAFYSDVQNLYSILKAAYEKMCVGLCVQESNNATKYLIADFQNVDAQLKKVEAHIINYISEFSVNEDIVNLSGFSANSQTASTNVNLHECSKRVALENGKKYGKLMVSPYFLSAAASNTVAQCKEETERTRQKALQEIQALQKSSQEKIDAIVSEYQAKILSATKQSQEDIRICQEQARQRMDQARIENDRKMAELKQTYAAVDTQINELNQTIRGKDKEISGLKKENQQTVKELESRNSDVKKLEDKISKLQQEVASLRGGGPIPPRGLSENQKKKIIIFLISFLATLLIALTLYLLLGKNGGKEDNMVKEQTKVEVPILTQLAKFVQGTQPTEDPTKEPTVTEVTVTRSEPDTILITEGGQEINEVECGNTYNLTLKGQNANSGSWVGPAFNITGNILMAKRDSAGKTCKIAYTVGGKEVAVKHVKIKTY